MSSDPVAQTLNIVFAVCHPDDEVVWAGGLLYEFAQVSFLRTYVVCLSGNDPDSARPAEFEATKHAAGYTAGVISGGKLLAALDPLPPPEETLAHGLATLGLQPAQIDLLITHAPYGDEHRNPHHIQTHRALKTWCAARNIGFAYFACIALAGVSHRSLLKDLRRRGTLRLLQLARCSGPAGTPRFYVQFATDAAAKARLAQCYPSIGLAEHDEAYTMFSNPCEALYLQDEKAMAPISALVDTMTAPGPSPLLLKQSLLTRTGAKLRHMLHGGG